MIVNTLDALQRAMKRDEAVKLTSDEATKLTALAIAARTAASGHRGSCRCVRTFRKRWGRL